LVSPLTPLASLVKVRLSVLASDPAEVVLTPTDRLFVVAPLPLAAKPVKPVAVTFALPVVADTSSVSW